MPCPSLCGPTGTPPSRGPSPSCEKRNQKARRRNFCFQLFPLFGDRRSSGFDSKPVVLPPPCHPQLGRHVYGESSQRPMKKQKKEGRREKAVHGKQRMRISAFSLQPSVFCFMAFCLGSVLADMTVTEPTGGQNISADRALNSTNGAAFTALGNIVITENSADDFADGSGVTLVLVPPFGWQFKAGTGSVLFTPGRNLSAVSIAVAADSATATFTVSGPAALDTLTISNLQVQAFDGLIDPFADQYIRPSSDNPGTAVIAGIDDFSSFAQLYEIPGAARALAVQTPPPPSATAGVIFNPDRK